MRAGPRERADAGAARGTEPQGIGAQRDAVEVSDDRGGVARILLRDDEVEVARPDGGEGRLRLALNDLDPQPRMLGREQGERL